MISRRRAVLAAGSATVGPATVTLLATTGRPSAALVTAGLLVTYWLAEIVAWELRVRGLA